MEKGQHIKNQKTNHLYKSGMENGLLKLRPSGVKEFKTCVL